MDKLEAVSLFVIGAVVFAVPVVVLLFRGLRKFLRDWERSFRNIGK